MPLYSNILLSGREDKPPDQPANQSETATKRPIKETTSASMKLLQDHLMSKKRAKQASQQATKVQKSIDRSRQTHSESGFLYKNSEFDWDLNDEYDPMMPNSYEVLQLEFVKAEELRNQQARKSAGRKIDLSILDALEKMDDCDETPMTSRGTAIAPPPTLVSVSSDANTIKSSPAPTNVPNKSQSSLQVSSNEKLDGSSAAAKIMAKMGYKAGQGLGRDQQGINAPLEFEQSGSNVGRIVQQTITTSPPAPEPAKGDDSNESPATRVLMLQNMVGPGEVDDELEAETKEECKKYGEVMKCLIYEIPNKQVPDEEAVRIFIEFKDVASSKRAASDLNGRYFGGRIVRASFYDQTKFDKYILAP